jgi:hypothetical protein
LLGDEAEVLVGAGLVDAEVGNRIELFDERKGRGCVERLHVSLQALVG